MMSNGKPSAEIRVLHIFAPNYQSRFGGPTIRWRSDFAQWKSPLVTHWVLDVSSGRVIDALSAFDGTPSATNLILGRKERFTWAFGLLHELHKHKYDYDIIHFHVLWWGSLLAAWWARQNHIPTIYESVLQGADTPESVRKERFGKVKLNLLRKFDRILAVSDALKDAFISWGFDEDRVHMLMNCVDGELFKPAQSEAEIRSYRRKFDLPEDKIIILFVGSIQHRKGVDLAIDAFIDVQNNYEDTYLLLVGPYKKEENPSYDEDFIRNIQHTLNVSGVFDKVRFLGMVEGRQALAEIYRLSDIFVFPSRREGLGNVVLEAMASGLPVVSSALPVLKNVIMDQVNGLTAPIDDSKGISKGISYLINYPSEAYKLGDCARQHILKNHTFSAWEADLTEIYHSLIDQDEND